MERLAKAKKHGILLACADQCHLRAVKDVQVAAEAGDNGRRAVGADLRRLKWRGLDAEALVPAAGSLPVRLDGHRRDELVRRVTLRLVGAAELGDALGVGPAIFNADVAPDIACRVGVEPVGG